MKSKNENSKGQFTLEEAERLATKLEQEFAPVCVKLKSLKPEVEMMQSMFKALCKGSVTIAGCRNFGEFVKRSWTQTSNRLRDVGQLQGKTEEERESR